VNITEIALVVSAVVNVVQTILIYKLTRI